MDERLYGSLPHAPSEYLQQWWVSPYLSSIGAKINYDPTDFMLL